MISSILILRLLGFIIWLVSEAWIAARDWTRLDKKQDQHTLGSLIVLILIGVVISTFVPSWRILDPQQFYAIAGLILVILGVMLRQWSVATLGKFFRRVVMVQSDHQVIQHGPYKFLRHPSYTGLLMSYIGYALLFNSGLGLIYFIVVFLALSKRIRVEEQALSSALGQKYTDYMSRTKKLIPFIY